MSDDAEPEPPKHVLKPTSFERVNAPLFEELSEPIEVKTILKDNLAVREAAAPFVLNLERKKSRRKRDYLFLLVGGGAAILLLKWALPPYPLLHVLGWSCLGLYSLGLTWLMWGVMDDY